MSEERITFASFRPSGFDAAGVGSDADNGHWIVMPCIQNRDSGSLERANFAVQESWLRDADETATQYEIHSFRHWAVGWFEICIINPDCPGVVEVFDNVQKQMDDYPCLDDMVWAQLEEYDEGDDDADSL
jgi:hypothetical protein